MLQGERFILWLCSLYFWEFVYFGLLFFVRVICVEVFFCIVLGSLPPLVSLCPTGFVLVCFIESANSRTVLLILLLLIIIVLINLYFFV